MALKKQWKRITKIRRRLTDAYQEFSKNHYRYYFEQRGRDMKLYIEELNKKLEDQASKSIRR